MLLASFIFSFFFSLFDFPLKSLNIHIAHNRIAGLNQLRQDLHGPQPLTRLCLRVVDDAFHSLDHLVQNLDVFRSLFFGLNREFEGYSDVINVYSLGNGPSYWLL